jgi:hypothetical protein
MRVSAKNRKSLFSRQYFNENEQGLVIAIAKIKPCVNLFLMNAHNLLSLAAR